MTENRFTVYHDKGGCITVYADTKEEAIEAFYESLASVLGHDMGICGCLGEPQPLDREKVVKPIRVVGPFKVGSRET